MSKRYVSYFFSFVLSLCILLLARFSAYAQNAREIDSVKLELSKATADTTRAHLMNELAYDYASNDPDNASKYASEALQLSLKLNDTFRILESYDNLGLAQYYQNRYNEALDFYHKAQEYGKNYHDQSKLATTLNNIGLIYDDKADYKTALDYYLKSLSLVDKSNSNQWQKASTLNNVGLMYKNLHQYDLALEYYNKSLKIKEAVGNKRGIGNSLHNIGMLYKLKGDLDKSLEYYAKALEMRKAVNDITGEALTLNNIGSVYEDLKQYEKAYPYYVEALKLRENLKDNYNLCINIYSLGSNYINRKLYKEGFENLEKALSIAKRIGAKELIKYGYEALAEAYAQQGDYEKAYQYQKQLVALKDSILNAETAQQLNQMQQQYESARKQNEIDILTKNDEIKQLQLNKNKLWLIALCVLILLIIVVAGMFYNRSQLKQKANQLLEHRNNEITQQKKEITDSINYAKRIQESILPPAEAWHKLLPDSFIFYRPKDIVSGDFYWIEQQGDVVCFAAVDCTGHGVPGALMSVVGFNLLTQAINEVHLVKPSDILKHLDAGVTKTLRQSEEGKGVKDGMDLSLCALNTKTLELQYAGAFNSLYHVRNNTLTEIKADKFPIGINIDDKVDDYTNHTLQLRKGDCIYLYSDGYADQFGGHKGKKFKYTQLKELLVSISDQPIPKQRDIIEQTFDSWRGKLEQVDDVVIIGVRV